ncbi:MAG: hypothetical protein RMJ98_02565, partial [Myxococcales bacterium]|nr:hypothetical protein [Polyangiaceae bacterium]MDW8248172.1 hypothetical protein [Myxococcales bacterium]
TYSCLVLSPGAWKEWYAKIGILHADAHINTVSLQALIAGETVREPVIVARRPLILVATLLFSGAIGIAARKKTLHQGAVAALMLLPVLMNPANYYLHLVCLYPLLVAEPLPRKKSKREGFPVPFTAAADSTSAQVALILLLMCASHYFAVLVQDRHIRFYQLSFSIVAGLAAVLFVLLRRDGPDLLTLLSPVSLSCSPPAQAPHEKSEDDKEGEDDLAENEPASTKS